MLKKINFISRAKRRYVLALCLVCALAGSLLLFRLTAIDRDLAATRDATNGSWNYAFVSRVGPDPQFMNSLEEQAREYAVLETLEVMARIRPGATDSAADGGAADSGTDSGGADSGGKGSEGTPIQLIRLVKYDAAAFAMMSLTPTEGAWTDTAGNMAIEARMANTAREGESLPDMEMTCELAELPQEAAVAVLAGQSAGELAFADRLSLNLQTEAAFKDFAAQLFPADLAASAQNAEFTQVVHWIVAAADFTRVLQAVDTSRSYHQHIVLAKINRTNAFPALAESWLADRGRLVASDDLSAQEKWQAGRRAILLNRYQLSDEELHGGQTELIRPNAQPENAVAARRIFQLSAQRASFGLLFLLIILVGALLYYSLQIGNISLPVLRNFKLSGLTNSNLRRLILGKEVGLSLLSIFVGWLLGSGIALVLPLISPETVNLLAFPTIGIQLLVLFLLAASQTLPYFLYALTKLARPPFAMTEQHAAFLGSQAPQRPRQPRKRILSADAGASRSKSERALGKLPTGYAGLLSRRAFSFNRRSKGGYYFVLLFLIIFAALLSFMQTVHAATYSEQFRSTDLSIGIQNSISRYSELS
ncbi:MAG: hypothetical protein GX907_03325, partial [Clostridiaceae bacterium]|nr:hypothetical protein [Clostridiaceae bacterium]